MENIRYLTDSFKGKLLSSQIVVIVVCGLITLAIASFWGWLAVQKQHEKHQAHAQVTTSSSTPASIQPPAQEVVVSIPQTQAEPTATPPPPTRDAAAISTESYDVEVARVAPTLPRGWTPSVLATAKMDEFPPARMGVLEHVPTGPWVQAAAAHWQGMAGVPVCAGNYVRDRVTETNWPRPGSLAVELVPAADITDAATTPWRVVVFINSAPEPSQHVTLYQGTYRDERIKLGAELPVVPVARVDGASGTTFYCLCPAASITLCGTKLPLR